MLSGCISGTIAGQYASAPISWSDVMLVSFMVGMLEIGMETGLINLKSNSFTSRSCSLLLLKSVAMRWTVDSRALILVASLIT